MVKKWFKEYIEANKQDILIVVTLLILGIVIGVGIYIFSSNPIKNLAIVNAKEVFEISKSEVYIKTNIILNGVKADVILIIILAIFTVTLFGKWGIYFTVLLKGIALAIYTILLFNIFGFLWGSLVVFLLVFLVNVIYLPAFIYLVVAFLAINFNLFKARINSMNITGVVRVVLTAVLSFVIMFSSIVVEQIVSMVALNIYTKL